MTHAIRSVPLLAVLLLLTSCRTMPLVDDEGRPILNPDGTPATRQELDTDAVEGVGGTIAALLPPPWNAIAAGGIGLIASVPARSTPPRSLGIHPLGVNWEPNTPASRVNVRGDEQFPRPAPSCGEDRREPHRTDAAASDRPRP